MQKRWYAFLLLMTVVMLSVGGSSMFSYAQSSETPLLADRVQALETTVATLQKSHAALATQVAVLAATPTPLPSKLLPTPTPLPTQAADDGPLFDILGVDGRITESNNVWWKFAYIVEIQNLSDKLLLMDATVEFLDADGFVIDDDHVYDILLTAGETKKVTGYALIDADVAANVDNINAKVRVTDSQ